MKHGAILPVPHAASHRLSAGTVYLRAQGVMHTETLMN